MVRDVALLRPPRHISPARLFRLFLRSPRPWLPIDLSLAGQDAGFSCMALSVADWDEVGDSADDAVPPLRREVREAELLSRCLYWRGERAFSSAAGLVRALSGAEIETAKAACLGALQIIDPQFPPCDFDAWRACLTKGANEPRNFRRAFTLSNCVDRSGMGSVTHRPERFFGCGLDELTESQWLAFYAARTAFQKHHR